MSDVKKAARKYQKGEPYSKLKNWWNKTTSSSSSETPKEAAKEVRKKKKKNWDFSDASLKNL